MSVHIDIFADPGALEELGLTMGDAKAHLGLVAGCWREPEDLVIVAYLVGGGRQFRGKTFLAEQGISFDDFRDFHDERWGCVERFGLPRAFLDVKGRFQAVLVQLGSEQAYPSVRKDRSGWSFALPSAGAHLSLVAAHELGHLRLAATGDRSEHGANAWAIDRLKSLGYRVKARQPGRSARRGKERRGDSRFVNSLLIPGRARKRKRDQPSDSLAGIGSDRLGILSDMSPERNDMNSGRTLSSRNRPVSRERLMNDLERDYQVFSPIGRGTESVVRKAVDRRTREVVCLKLLRAPSEGGEDGPWLGGYKLARRVWHPSLQDVLRIEQRCDRAVIVSRHISGCTLARRLQRLDQAGQRMSLAEITSIFHPLAAALDRLHLKGVHRDVKPNNILIDRRGKPVLVDFGTACSHERFDNAGLGGTRGFASPEVMRGKQAGPEADVYSLTACLFMCLTGCHPLRFDDLPSRLRPGLPPSIDDVVLHGMARKPEKRPSWAGDLFRAYICALADAGVTGVPERTRHVA